MDEKKTLNERMTFADMVQAVDKWYGNGAMPKKLRDDVKEALALAFQIACAEYLTAKTDTLTRMVQSKAGMVRGGSAADLKAPKRF